MKLSWDESKRRNNLAKLRLDFRDAALVFPGLTLTFEDERFAYDERRFITIGFLRSKPVVIAHAETGDEDTRIISMRKATKNEEKIFYRALRNR